MYSVPTKKKSMYSDNSDPFVVSIYIGMFKKKNIINLGHEVG